MEKFEINILFFGALKKFFGESMTIPVHYGISIAEVVHVLVDLKPEATDVLNSCQYAIDSNMVGKQHSIAEKCELALLPPYSGG